MPAADAAHRWIAQRGDDATAKAREMVGGVGERRDAWLQITE